MNRLKILFLSVLLSVTFSFVAFGNEGMGYLRGSDTNQVWEYMQKDGTSLKNQWKNVWDNWYYFGDDGASKQSTWAEINEKWYYFDQWSIMLHDTMTPDGYTVGSDGAWLADVPQKTE